ncbi:MAG: Hsp70 family protein [Pseudomonadota bacterium]
MAVQDDIVIGIDLGTTYSCAAVVREGRPHVIPSEQGYLTVPSVVALDKTGGIIVGQPALDQIVINPTQTIFGSKRLIGRKFNSILVQKMLGAMTYPIVEGPNSEAAVILGGKMRSMTEISSHILGEVKEMAQGRLGTEIHRAIITVPAYYNDNQRQAVVEAGKRAGFTVEGIVNEPTAAAIAYGYNKGLEQKILVYDLGGGTLDISILKVRANSFTVLATGGNTFLGGVDFDTRITEHMVEKFNQATGKDLTGEKVAMQRVRSAAEHAKRELSTEKIASIELPYITEVDRAPVDLKMKLTREQLVNLTSDLVERTIETCGEVLASIPMKTKDLDEILLVGGQTRMPLVQSRIAEFFGKPPRKGVHPDEVVALGAAILADSVAKHADVRLSDVLAIPIGVALPSGKFKAILRRNTPLPASKTYKLTADEKSIEIDIYQGESKNVLENEYLGTFCFPSPPRQKRGSRKLEMRFDLSPQCLLRVQATDLGTGEKTYAQMVTQQTPKSLVAGMEAAMASRTRKPHWLVLFAQRILGK